MSDDTEVLRLPGRVVDFRTVALSCVQCGVRADHDIMNWPQFARDHGEHIREFLQTFQVSRPTWSAASWRR